MILCLYLLLLVSLASIACQCIMSCVCQLYNKEYDDDNDDDVQKLTLDQS